MKIFLFLLKRRKGVLEKNIRFGYHRANTGYRQIRPDWGRTAFFSFARFWEKCKKGIDRRRRV